MSRNIILSILMALAALSLGGFLFGYKYNNLSQKTSLPPALDFEQDDDPYPDEYLLNGTGSKAKQPAKSLKPRKALQTSEIKTQLEKDFPGIKVEEVAKGPVPYLYQVKTEGEVFFTTTDGDLMFVGDLIDLKGTKTNYTEQARSVGRSALLRDLNSKDSINFEAADPKYTITVFTDTDCGYCREFHSHMKEYNALGISVHYVAFPRAGLQSKTFETMQTVWCSKDRAAALTAAKKGEILAKQSCDTHNVVNQYDLGKKLGIRGTPSLLLKDGILIPGYMPADKLKETLDKHFIS